MKGTSLPCSTIGLLTIVLVCLTMATGCKKNEPSSDCSVFNRQAYLENLAFHSIIPGYAAYKEQSDSLHISCVEFGQNPTLDNLFICREKLYTTTLSWQYVAMFEFGPAEVLTLQASTNTYPADTALILTKISNSDFNIESVSSLSARGLPALDYLLHGPVSFADDDVLGLFVDDEDALNRLEYLSTLSAALLDQASSVQQSWSSSGGDYSSEFIASTGTSVGSSMGQFLNAFNKSYEGHTRTEKVGIPVGALTFSQTPLPDRVEGYFGNDFSKAYLMASIQAFEQLFLGHGMDGENYPALAEYLRTLEAQYNGDELADEIQGRISVVKSGVENIDSPFSEYVVDNQTDAFALYADMQQLNVLWKVDMMSALGILITYQDNDGD